MAGKTRWLAAVAGVAIAAAVGWPGGAGAQDPAPLTGAFSAPFAEPTINGVRTDMKCIRRPPREGREPSGPLYTPYWDCKPAAVSNNVTPVGNRLVYWNGLEGMENVNMLVGGEFGTAAVNDQSRALDLNLSNPFLSRWSRPTPVDGGASGTEDKEFVAVPDEIGRELDPKYNDGALFCADNNFLPDGRVLATGGTIYKNDPPTGSSGTQPGPVELQGARETRVYDPRTNTWRETPKMHYGRWYPTIVTLGSRGGRTGDTFAASGVKNLLKAYDKPQEPYDPENPDFPPPLGTNRTGDNVQETEIRDSDSGYWQVQGPKDAQDPSDRPLPLYPRLHLLPNGHVYYNAAGQVFNPAGESYNEALWNVAAAFDPATRRWNDVGVPGTAPDGAPSLTAGFRGSTFSVMLPLRPDADGSYRRASFLTAGGILGTTPGTYFAIPNSRIDTVNTGAATTASPSGTLTSRETGPLNQPRWYSSGTLLPTGEVLATSGAREDEVVAPGFETPVQQAELFDPETETWRRDATANRLRTYHNTAVLLPDARVLVGGHAPIPFAYGRGMVPQDPEHPNRPYAGGVPGAYNQPSSKNDGRDPTMEIYTPPYLRTGRPQPSAPRTSRCHPSYGGTMELELSHPASELDKVVLVRNPAVTHVVDGDQRQVELPILWRSGNRVVVRRPPNANVAPPGPYMLFANRRTADGPIPSRAAQVYIGPDACPWDGDDDDSDDDDSDDD